MKLIAAGQGYCGDGTKQSWGELVLLLSKPTDEWVAHVQIAEACDDGNQENGDCCSSQCVLTPATCTPMIGVEVGGSTGGSVSFNPTTGVHRLTARGTNFLSSNSNDQFFFYHQPVSASRTTVTMFARFVSSIGGDSWSKVGVMVRESLAVKSKGFFSGRYLNQVLALSSVRSATDGNATAQFLNVLRPWLRVERNGNLFSASQSLDGVNWVTLHNRVPIDLDPATSALWGIAFVSRSSTPGTADLADISIRDGVCGDGLVQSMEQCDDGNIVDGDCCSRWCTLTC